MFCILNRSGRLGQEASIDRDASRAAPHRCKGFGRPLAFLRAAHDYCPVPIDAASAVTMQVPRGVRIAQKHARRRVCGTARTAMGAAAPSVARGPQPPTLSPHGARDRTRPTPSPRLSPQKNARRAPRAIDAPAPADLRQDADGQDHHARRGAERHDRQRQTKNPGQGGHPAGPAAPHLRGQAVGRWPHAERLQHPEGVDAPPRPALKRRPLPGALRHLRRPEARVGAPRGLRDDREGHGPDHGALRQDGRGPARHQPDDALGEHEGGALREDHRPRRELCGNQNPTARLC